MPYKIPVDERDFILFENVLDSWTGDSLLQILVEQGKCTVFNAAFPQTPQAISHVIAPVLDETIDDVTHHSTCSIRS